VNNETSKTFDKNVNQNYVKLYYKYARLYLDNIEYTKKAINSIHNVGNWRTINTNNVI
jgi:hypothetical protein